MSTTSRPPMRKRTIEPASRRPDRPAPPADQQAVDDQSWRTWMIFGIGATALLAVIAVIFGVVAIADNENSGQGMSPSSVAQSSQGAGGAQAAAPTLADAHGMSYERFKPVDPTLPAVPAGPVKKFTVGVMQHITQVDPKLAPVQAWTYTVNGVAYRGTAASPPIVVNQGDRVQMTFVNGASRSMGVDMGHSIDFHSAQVAPNKYYVDIAPGRSETFSFTAKHPGVFMYHCATQPVLTHTGTGMTGMMLVKPRNLPLVAKELWITQQEFYIGQPGGIADQAKLSAETPDVIAFNGYANQYKLDPIAVPAHRPIRMYVLDAGPSKWSAFHVIGTVFDATYVEGVIGHDSQTISLAPSQGGWVQFELDEAGNYPFVTHAFGDMTKGAAGMLHTVGAPPPKGAPLAPAGGSSKPVLPSMIAAKGGQGTASSSMGSMAHGQAGSSGDSAAALAGAVQATMGEMWIHANATSHKAGKVTFSVANQGQVPHWFAIARTPVQMDSAGTPAASGLIAKSAEMAPGASANVSASLPPGRYELVCIMPGHYAAGQHIPFTVTS
jgi:nitrite reductase (NO-forming)